MPYEIIAFLVVLGIIIFLKYWKGSLSGLTKLWPGSGNGESGEKSGFFKNFFAEVSEAEKSNFRKWREREKSEKDLWEMYAATAVLGILVAWITPDDYIEYRYAAAAVAVLLMLHLVVWPFFTKRTSTISKVVLSAIIIFYPAAWLIPAPTKDGSGFADGVSAAWRIIKKAGQNGSAAMVKIADDYEKGIDSGASQSVEQTAVAKAEITSVQLTIPVDETVFVAPPHGYRLSSALCPPENVMEVTGNHDEVLRQVDCAGRITLEEAELYGRKFAFFQKQGASQPSVVVVRWVKIS